jgi:YgiT-type zinc finger domain-containing protein
VVCRTGTLHDGATTVTVERGAMTLVLKGVPARVCDTCGEGYVGEATTRRLESLVDQLQTSGVQIAVQQYAAA